MPISIAGICFTNAQGITFGHAPYLVVLSYAIAVCGSYTALEAVERWRNARGTSILWWQLFSAAVLGGTIWSMHFVGALAISVNVPVTYTTGLTLTSLAVVIVVVGCGLQIIRMGISAFRIGCAGAIIGLGVAAMHYIGMAALNFPGTVGYTPTLWGLSIVVGIAAAIAALWLSVTLQRRWHRAASAVVMGAAICGMHYIGMAATVLDVDPLVQGTVGYSSGPIAAAVGGISIALILWALGMVTADRRVKALIFRETELLKSSNSVLTRLNLELERGRQHFDAVLTNMTQGVCLFDSEQRLLACNQRYAEIYDLPREAIQIGRLLQDIVAFRNAAGSGPDMGQVDYLSWRDLVATSNTASNTIVPLKNGRIVAIHHQPMPGGGWVATHEDITERRRAEAAIAFMAHHDALTRLPNRVLFRERLEQAIALAGRGTTSAVFCLDLDKFKAVNDTLGHPVGDGLLQAAADRLQACVRDVDTVARIGGDEFAIIQLGVHQPDDAERLANRIVAAFEKPFAVSGHQIIIGTSVGVTIAPNDGSSAELLLKNADIALYLAKQGGASRARFFEPEMDARIHARRALETDLQAALAGGQFELYYQPMINLADGGVTAFEALLRWHHPMRGLVSPQEFIPAAEESGLIVPIGEWVLSAACCEAQTWPPNIGIAVNLSAVQFDKGDLVRAVEVALGASGLRPDRLELEITESVLMRDQAATLTALRQIRAMGATVALDDFGTGYSSLGYLRSFPFDKIKIDQSFVRDLASNKESMSIIRAVTGLGSSLGMKTTAEGVETVEQLELLRREGCTEVQGYLFSRPRPANELLPLIESLSGPSAGHAQTD